MLQKATQIDGKLLKTYSTAKGDPQVFPPAPQLVYRSANTMIFKPDVFAPQSKEAVMWYQLFVRSASGNNVKVRLSDTTFHGSGIEVSETHAISLKLKTSITCHLLTYIETMICSAANREGTLTPCFCWSILIFILRYV